MQLKRDTRELPRLVLSDGVGFFDYTLDDIRIEGYDPHPHIKGDVSV
jgi:thymidylate synthase